MLEWRELVEEGEVLRSRLGEPGERESLQVLFRIDAFLIESAKVHQRFILLFDDLRQRAERRKEQMVELERIAYGALDGLGGIPFANSSGPILYFEASIGSSRFVAAKPALTADRRWVP